jgi:hypothetical protein
MGGMFAVATESFGRIVISVDWRKYKGKNALHLGVSVIYLVVFISIIKRFQIYSLDKNTTKDLSCLTNLKFTFLS